MSLLILASLAPCIPTDTGALDDTADRSSPETHDTGDPPIASSLTKTEPLSLIKTDPPDLDCDQRRGHWGPAWMRCG